jgi:hypothetical protein
MSIDTMRHSLVWFIIIIFLIFSIKISSFDWELYFQNNPELKSKAAYGWPWAFGDYLSNGIKLGRTSILELPPSSNFDWKYYVGHNQLHCNDEMSALCHYQTEGFFQHLPYCCPYTLVIMLHMYNLDLLDECIDQLNHFMRINSENTYYIKINIPVASNIINFFSKKNNYEKLSEIYESKHDCCNVYDGFNLINVENTRYLQLLVHYINQSLCIDSNRLEIIFSPNRGRDIGGFFLSLDRLFKQNIPYDYIVKIHSKTSPKGPPLWRQLNMSFLNIHINPILRDYDCVYANRIHFSIDSDSSTKANESLDKAVNGKNVMHLLDYFKVPPHDFNFCGGNMFIVSKKLVEFFRPYDLRDLFYSLNDETSFADALDGKIEHAYERFFGYLIQHLGFKTFLLDYHPLLFPEDNSIAKYCNVSIDYDVEDVKKLVLENNIKVMALYSPIYYQEIESSEKQLDFWQTIKNSKQQIKRPHFDVGYYNILDWHTRKKQAFIARKYGIEAFCYQHFWSHGHSLMAQGLEKILEDGEPNMPFTLCWMNGDGVPYVNQEMIYDYDDNDKEEHYAYVSKFFKHPLYIKHNNCPVLYVQCLDCLHDRVLRERLDYWQECARGDGFSGLDIISLCTCATLSRPFSSETDPICSDTFCLIHSPKTAHQIEQSVAYDSTTHPQSLFYGVCDIRGAPLLTHMSYRLFERFLQKTIINISTRNNKDFKYIFLVSWNDWYMQSMFEPNDHDEYELLKIIQRYFV